MDEGKTAGPPTMAGAHPRRTLRRVRSSPQDRPHSLPLRLPLPLSLRLQVQSSGCPIHRALCDGWDVKPSASHFAVALAVAFQAEAGFSPASSPAAKRPTALPKPGFPGAVLLVGSSAGT